MVTRFACLAGVLFVALGIITAPASAAAKGSSSASSSSKASGCEIGALSKPFARFGDAASYSLLAGGSFEADTAGWSLTKAAVAAGNESYSVAGGSRSLAIQPTGQAVSPPFCVSIAHPTLRFFARQTSGSWAVLNVILRWTDAAGGSHDTTIGSLQGGTSWSPTPVLALATTLPLWQAGETLSVRLLLKPEAYGGAWAVDDVFVDPRMR